MTEFIVSKEQRTANSTFTISGIYCSADSGVFRNHPQRQVAKY